MDSKELTDKEQVKEINKLAIITGIQSLLANPDIKDNIGVSTTILGSKGEMELKYRRDKFDRSKLSSIAIILISPKTGKWIAQRDYDIFIEQENPNEVIIEGMVNVKEAQDQSLGYGSGLLMCTNIVIEDAIRRYPEFRGKLVIGRISDAATGREENGQETVSREGWTSHLAKQLGYTNIKGGNWEKVYQHAGKNK